MHRSGLGGVVIDCGAGALSDHAAFWGAALGYPVLRRTRSFGNDYVILDTPAGRPYVELQRVEHESRVHLDIKTDDLDAEVARLQRLGAVARKRIGHWWVMQAPSGHGFCVVALHPGENRGALLARA